MDTIGLLVEREHLLARIAKLETELSDTDMECRNLSALVQSLSEALSSYEQRYPEFNP